MRKKDRSKRKQKKKKKGTLSTLSSVAQLHKRKTHTKTVVKERARETNCSPLVATTALLEVMRSEDRRQGQDPPDSKSTCPTTANRELRERRPKLREAGGRPGRKPGRDKYHRTSIACLAEGYYRVFSTRGGYRHGEPTSGFHGQRLLHIARSLSPPSLHPPTEMSHLTQSRFFFFFF
jgi:hypothetical protein